MKSMKIVIYLLFWLLWLLCNTNKYFFLYKVWLYSLGPMQTKYSRCWSLQGKQKQGGRDRQAWCHVRSGQGPGQPSAALVTDPADQKYCCSFFWIVLQGREEDSNNSSTCCVWSQSVMALCVWWMGWEDEGLLTFDGVWVSQPSPQASLGLPQLSSGKGLMDNFLFLVISCDQSGYWLQKNVLLPPQCQGGLRGHCHLFYIKNTRTRDELLPCCDFD